MADYFQFTSTSTYVREKLSAIEFSQITRWQNGTYDFSFHTMHEAGWPLYIIEQGMRGQRNRPKINLKDKTAAQAEYLEGKFDDKQVGVDAKAVAVANWAAFQKMARMFYEGVTVTPAVVMGPKMVLEYSCSSLPCAGRRITQEYEGPPAGATPPPMALSGLGVCKMCRQKKWSYQGSRPLRPGEKPDIPLTQTAPAAV